MLNAGISPGIAVRKQQHKRSAEIARHHHFASTRKMILSSVKGKREIMQSEASRTANTQWRHLSPEIYFSPEAHAVQWCKVPSTRYATYARHWQGRLFPQPFRIKTASLVNNPGICPLRSKYPPAKSSLSRYLARQVLHLRWQTLRCMTSSRVIVKH